MKAVAALSLLALACGGSPAFDLNALRQRPAGEGLPPGFLLGAGTSAHQVEGGLTNDWTEWERGTFEDGTPHILHGQASGRAANSWEQWPEDVSALTSLGANAYRLSVEWSRLEPQEGVWNAEAEARYRAQLEALRANGIEPFVTLFHFTLPPWVAERGGWEWEGAVPAFERFCRKVAGAFGDQVDLWVTVNEPTVYALYGYGSGKWPPGVRDMVRATRVLLALLRAHAAATAAVRAADGIDANADGFATRVGLAHHVVILQPASSSPLDAAVASAADDWANESVPRAARTGRVRLSIPGQIELDEEVPGLAGSFDWLGLNYYYRLFVRGDLSQPALAHLYVPPEAPRSDLGGELFAQGLYPVLRRYQSYGWPLYITENGVADAADALRGDFLRLSLHAVSMARREGADVRGYLHWSLLDNFEWAEGYEGRFGLFAIDFADPTLARRPRASTQVFREAAQELGRP